MSIFPGLRSAYPGLLLFYPFGVITLAKFLWSANFMLSVSDLMIRLAESNLAISSTAVCMLFLFTTNSNPKILKTEIRNSPCHPVIHLSSLILPILPSVTANVFFTSSFIIRCSIFDIFFAN